MTGWIAAAPVATSVTTHSGSLSGRSPHTAMLSLFLAVAFAAGMVVGTVRVARNVTVSHMEKPSLNVTPEPRWTRPLHVCWTRPPITGA